MTNLSTTVVDTLRQQIVQGTLQPGDKLPAESALERDFAVSRTVIREALSRLQAAGLVEKYRGKGTYVLTRPADHRFAAPTLQPRSRQDRIDLLDFRMGIEAETAALAARRRSTVQLTAARATLEDFSRWREKPSSAISADFAFHRALAVAANNRLFLDLLESLGPTMIAMPRTRLAPTGADAQEDHFGKVQDEHGAIYRAVEQQDPQGSSAAMRTHLTNTRNRLLAAPS